MPMTQGSSGCLMQSPRRASRSSSSAAARPLCAAAARATRSRCRASTAACAALRGRTRCRAAGCTAACARTAAPPTLGAPAAVRLPLALVRTAHRQNAPQNIEPNGPDALAFTCCLLLHMPLRGGVCLMSAQSEMRRCLRSAAKPTARRYANIKARQRAYASTFAHARAHAGASAHAAAELHCATIATPVKFDTDPDADADS